jgi:TolA-binding protein
MKSQLHSIKRLPTVSIGTLYLLCAIGVSSVLLTLAGCQTGPNSWASRSWRPFGGLTGTGSQTPPPTTESSDPQAEAPVVATAGGSLTDQLPGTNRLVGFITGDNQDLDRAKQLYQQGDELFRQATKAAKEDQAKLFSKAADAFRKAGNAAPGSGLEQDARFMQGESLFFADDLTEARDVYEKLQKEFPRNKFSDQVAARLFSIGKYWIDTAKAGADPWYTLNLFDRKRPARDSVGHAIKVLDQIRYDNPTGKLADDATMAAAVEHIRNERFERADEFLTDLRETFTDSDHQFLAHLLGIRCKLEVYAGPHYSELVLNEAAELVEQTRRRFPNELRDPKYSEILARAAAEIEFHQAEDIAHRARYRSKQRHYGAARELYQQLLRDHPTTPQADEARKVLAKIEQRPAHPDQPLAWLTKVFPDSRQSPPLETVQSQAATDATDESDSPSDRNDDTPTEQPARPSIMR